MIFLFGDRLQRPEFLLRRLRCDAPFSCINSIMLFVTYDITSGVSLEGFDPIRSYGTGLGPGTFKVRKGIIFMTEKKFYCSH